MAHDSPRTETTPNARQTLRSETRTSQTYAAFLKDLCRAAQVDWDLAEQVAASVLCALEQRLTGGQGRHLEAQLPAKVRELLVRCNRHEGKPPEKFGAKELVTMVADDLTCRPDQAELHIRAVCDVLAAHVTEGELRHVKQELPEDIRAYFRPPV
jgi:uncharacterized protein (DUF2267 family)